MSKWTTTALAALAFAGGFATAEIVDRNEPISTPQPIPSPAADDLGLEMIVGEGWVEPKPLPGSAPVGVVGVPREVREPSEIPSPSVEVGRVAQTADNQLWMWRLVPVGLCEGFDCKPCTIGKCGAPAPPLAAAGEPAPIYEFRFCRDCAEENCIRSVRQEQTCPRR